MGVGGVVGVCGRGDGLGGTRWAVRGSGVGLGPQHGDGPQQYGRRKHRGKLIKAHGFLCFFLFNSALSMTIQQ